MAKLVFKDKFNLEIEVNNEQIETITGTVRELRKTEQKELQTLFKEDKKKEKELNKLIKEATRFEEKFNKNKDTKSEEQIEAGYEKLDKYEEDIEEQTQTLNSDEMRLKGFRLRFDKTIESDKKDRLKAICEEEGYIKVFEAINRGVQELNEKK